MDPVLKEIELPDFGMCEELTKIPATEFENRMLEVLTEMQSKNIDVLLIFADREHSANLAFLTNLDPRFEEGLLMLRKDGKRKMLLGNECMGYTGICPIPMEYELYQEFSLMGQDRSKSRPLPKILSEFGIKKGMKVGCSYYKYFPKNQHALDIPSYLADLLRDLVSVSGSVINASDIFMDAAEGLRNRNCLEQLVRFEWASTRTSESIKRLVRQIRPGISEYELAKNYSGDGLPYSCHPMVSSGEKAKLGLSSPSGNRIELQDPFTCAFGIEGALNCRAGMVGDGPEQLDDKTARFFERYWKGYFKTVVCWYENIGIGIEAGSIAEKAEEVRDSGIFDFAVNTGHTLHLDEWVNSPFFKGSAIKLFSGMALQMDIIPVSKGAFVCANMEDGVVLADEKLREEWKHRFPASWKRIQARREFMMNKIGINIKEEVLPLSNMPAYYAPYLLNSKKVAVSFTA